MLKIRNNKYKEITFEFFLPEYEICGLKLAPIVETIKPGDHTEINIQYDSFFKKLGAFTLQEL